MTIDSTLVKKLAFEVGFDLCGIASAEPLGEDASQFARWLNLEYHGEMGYLARDPERRGQPRLVLEGARSIIVLGLNYFQPDSSEALAGFGRVSKYARGRDYHNVIERMHKELTERLRELVFEDAILVFRSLVDYGPLLERAYAQRAGLGYIGRNGMLISRQFGSWIFLSEIITNLELEPDDPKAIKHGTCGTCRICIEACPTQAIVEDRVVDSRRCISYLTIERPTEIAQELADEMGDRIFGCDICQDVCPHNRSRQKLTSQLELLAKSGVGEFLETKRVLALQSREEFLALTAGTPLTRTKLEGLKRNAVIMEANEIAGRRIVIPDVIRRVPGQA